MQAFTSMIKMATFLAIYFVVAVMVLIAGNLSITLPAALFCFAAYLLSLRAFPTPAEATQNISPWPPFLIAFFVYGNTYAFVLHSGIELIYPGLETSKQYTTLAQTHSTLAFAIMCALATLSAFLGVHHRANPYYADHKHHKKKSAGLIIVTNILLTAISTGYFLTIVDDIAAQTGRVGIAKQFNLYLWVFAGWIHLLFYFSAIIETAHTPKNTTSRNRLVTAILLLAIYCAMDSALGGRKIIAAALLGTIYGGLRYGVPRLRKILMVIPVAVLAMSVRAVFYDKFSGEADGLASIALQLGGEFVFTFLTFPTTIASECEFYESSISSYLMTVLQFIPRIFWNDKPLSLAQTLSNFLYDGQEGFAIVPMAEAWCTFGWGAPFIFPIIIGVLFFILQKTSSKTPIIGFIIYAHALELNRGEISYLVLQIVILYTIYAFGGSLAALFRANKLRAAQGSPC